MNSNNILEVSETRKKSHHLIKGDPDDALKTCQTVIKGSITMPRQEHMYEEPCSVLVVPTLEDNEFTVYATTCGQNFSVNALCNTLGVARSRIHIHTKRVGGSFGGKLTRPIPMMCAVALAAQITRQPVRLTLTRDEDIRITGQRATMLGEYEFGVTDGQFIAAKYELHQDVGWNTDMCALAMSAGIPEMEGPYAFPNIE